jgi:hypothetical protein
VKTIKPKMHAQVLEEFKVFQKLEKSGSSNKSLQEKKNSVLL